MKEKGRNMKKRILKNGNSYAVIIPVAYLEILGINKESYKNYSVDITPDFENRSIIIKNAKLEDV